MAVGLAVATLSQPVKVEAVQRIEKTQTVYNFAVDNTHTYFVGKTGLWVHNQCSLRSKLKVDVNPFRHKPDVQFEPSNTWFERQGMSKLSQNTGKKVFSAPNSQKGFDGWLDAKNTGQKFTLKYTDETSAESVIRKAQEAESKANANGFKGSNMVAVIDAPNVDLVKVLEALQPNGHLDRIVGRNNTLSRIVIYCKGRQALYLD